jgi:ribulose-bisphosphate carboxylase large chain
VTPSSTGRIRAVYELAAASRRIALARARALTVEQTVEVPAACVPPASRGMVGRIAALERRGARRWRAHCSYDPAVVGDSLLQLLNLLFGNASLGRGARLADLVLPPRLLARFSGPAFGVAGLRQLCGVPRRPLLCAPAKPIGLSGAALARICYAFAAGGADIVKDDHGLADQRAAPFKERVARCHDAVGEANAHTGGHAIYVPNLARGGPQAFADLHHAVERGCRAVLLSPLLIGPDTVRAIAARGEVAVLAHPTFTGSLLQRRHGIAPDVLYGTLFRLMGSDAVIYPNAESRFPLALADCLAINHRLRAPLGRLAPAFPVAGGGVDAARVPHWIRRYGPDTMFLVGSSLYTQRDLRAATARLVESIRRSSDVADV